MAQYEGKFILKANLDEKYIGGYEICCKAWHSITQNFHRGAINEIGSLYVLKSYSGITAELCVGLTQLLKIYGPCLNLGS